MLVCFTEPLTAIAKGAASQLLRDQGIAMSIAATVTSAVAGVYTQRFLQNNFTSVWEGNIVLSALNVIITICTAAVRMPDTLAHPFKAWDVGAIAVSLSLAGYGLLVSASLKYNSSLHKAIITTVSLCVSFAVDVLVFNEATSAVRVISAALIVAAAVAYSKYPAKMTSPATITKPKSE
jgi:drug/metabolite transporter (DMT)-like permease